MKKRLALLQFMFVASLVAYSAVVCSAQALPPLKLVQTIPNAPNKMPQPRSKQRAIDSSVDTEFMPVMTCHFDRFGLDLKNGRLFVVAENDGTIEIYSMSSGELAP